MVTQHRSSIAAVMATLVIIAIAVAFTWRGTAHGTNERLISPADQAILSASSSAQVAAALADGVVTDDEYQAAVKATRECLSGAGIALGDPTTTADGSVMYEYGGASAPDQHAQENASYDSCYQQNQRSIDVARSFREPPSPESIEKSRVAFIACINAGGTSALAVPPTTPMAPDTTTKQIFSMDSSVAAWRECAANVVSRFGTMP